MVTPKTARHGPQNAPRRDAFVDRILALMTPLGSVHARRMFGGHGIYLDDAIFAILHDGRLYLKTDAQTEPAFRAAGCRPFTYRRQGRTVALPYWRIPDDALTAMDAMIPWARQGLAAARRARTG